MLKNSENKGMTLLVVVAMSFMATLDSSIVNVALPVMSKKLAVPLSSIEWVIASYSIIICSTLLFFGRLGDLIGKEKVFQAGTVLFTLGSLACGMCSSFVPLIICRFLQGVGASAYMANNQGIITGLYPKEQRGRALGILAAAVALGTMIGPSAGGLIVSFLPWNIIFLVNVPIGIAVFLLGRKYLPAGVGSKEKMDYRGAVLQFAGTLLFFGAFIQAQKIGLENPTILAAILASVLLIGLFLHSESRQEQPLLQLGIFHSRLFSLGLLCAFISYICIAASTILLPFYFQDTMKMSPSSTGFFLMLSPLIIAALSPFCGVICDRIGSELLALFGLLMMSVGFFLMSFLQEHSPLICAAMFVAVMAVGQSFFQPANNSLIMSACPKERLGIAGSVNSLMRNLGQIVGITLSTTFLYSFMSQKLHYRVADYVPGRDDVFIYGMKNDYLILTVLCLAGACVTTARLITAGKKQNGQKAVAD